MSYAVVVGGLYYDGKTHWLSLIKVAATQAVRKEATEPAMKALVATLEMWAFLWAAR